MQISCQNMCWKKEEQNKKMIEHETEANERKANERRKKNMRKLRDYMNAMLV